MTILAQSDLTANTNNLVLALAAAATVNILLANRTGNAVNVSLAVVPSGTGSPGNQHWIEYQLPLDGNMPLERGGIPLGTGDQIFVNPSGPGVGCTVVAINI
jgi:hypothetical protein